MDVTSDRQAQEQGFKTIAVLTRLVITALLLTIVLDVAGIVSDISYHNLVERLLAGDFESLDQAQAADDRQRLIGLAQLALFGVTAVVFIWWFRRAYANLIRLGVSPLRWRIGWATGFWLIPLVNLVQPKRIANDIWRGSDPALPAQSTLPSTSVPWFYEAWWTTFIIAGFFGRIAFQHSRDADTLSSISSASLLLVASDALDIVAALLAAIVVYRTAARQQTRATKLAAD